MVSLYKIKSWWVLKEEMKHSESIKTLFSLTVTDNHIRAYFWHSFKIHLTVFFPKVYLFWHFLLNFFWRLATTKSLTLLLRLKNILDKYVHWAVTWTDYRQIYQIKCTHRVQSACIYSARRPGWEGNCSVELEDFHP